MRNGKERKLLSSSPVQQQQQVDCEVGLGLKMQLHSSSSSYSSCDGAPFFNASTNQPHIYDHSNAVLLHRTTLDNAAASTPPYANYGIGGINMNMNMNMNMNVMGGSGSVMYGGGKGSSISSVFTRSQLQELEKQKMIHKYILANIPVPPQLLLPYSSSSSSSSSLSSLSQCNTVATSGMAMDMRYGGGNGSSDPEPWRCKRTDGKKWRCSRDVAGDQKYCERHAHKNRPRSRKHVEPNKPPSSSSSSTITNTNTNTTTPQLQRSSSQFPYDQTRCIEWLMRGGIGNNSDNTNPPLSLSNNKHHQQWDQMMQNSVPSSKINYDDHNDHVSVYHPQFAEKQAAAPYMDDPDTAQATTRLFIDSWGKDATKGLSEDKKMTSSSSLSLSMSSRVGEGDHDRDRDDEEKGYDLGIGMMIGMNHQQQQQWLNPISWINSLSSSSSAGGGGAPGGPLGEALCLGNGGMNLAAAAAASLPSPQNHTTQHGSCYAIAIANNANSNSNSNTNSSKSSCQDASHALNFIG